MKRKMVIFITTLSGGGAERAVSEITSNLGSDWDPTIVLYRKEIRYPYKGKILSLDSHPSRFILQKVKNVIIRIFKFKKILEKERPEIVMSIMDGPSLISLIAKSIFCSTDIKFIVNVQVVPSLQYRGFIGKLYNFAIKALYGKCDLIIVISEGIKDDLTKNHRIPSEKIRVIHNAIDINRATTQSLEDVEHPWFKEDVPIIITVGRLTEQKGHCTLIKAFSKVRSEIPTRLVIIGEGNLRRQLEELIEKLHLYDSVAILGWQDNPFKFLSKAAVFVLPSLWEGFGNILTEAMAVGVPVISTDCRSGPKEILLDNKYGLLVPVGDEYSLSTAIIDLLRNKELRTALSESGRERAGHFDIRRIIIEYEDAFRSVLSG